MSYSYAASIGRNYSTGDHVFPSMRGEAMSLTLWEQFIEDVKADMLKVPHQKQIELVTVHRGMGEWEGVEEESAIITVVLKSALPEYSDNARDMLALRRYLSENARQYGQDTIALTVGNVEFC